MKLPFKITDEPIGNYKEYPGLDEIIEDLYYEIPETKGKVIKKIKDLIEKYPAVPVLKNYLFTAYQLKGEKDKLKEIALQTVKEHPEYLFGRIMLSQIYIDEKKFDQVPGLMSESFNILDLYPDRELFHIGEARSYYYIAVKYYLGIEKHDIALEKYKILNLVAPDSDQDKTCRNLLMTELFGKVKKSPLLSKENSKSPQYKDPDYDEDCIGKAPVFVHSEIWELYTHDISIGEPVLKNILLLPRESLISDLKKVVWDSIFRFDHFYNNKDLKIEFPLHALLLLSEINATESISDILEIVRQDNRYVDFYFGDMLSDFFCEILFKLGKNNLNTLSAIVKEPNLIAYCKAQVPSAVAQIAIHQPERREDVISWFREIFEFYVENRENEDLLDTDLLGLMICDVFDFCGSELLPQIREMFNLKIVNPNICGTYEAVENDMNTKRGFDKKEIHPDIFSFYRDIKDKWYNKNTIENEGEEEEDKTDEINNNLHQKVNDKPSVKTGRNDPCPCGSGKKYKKCCLKN